MAGISTANDETESLDTLRGRWRYALARLKSDPIAAAYVPDFTAFGPKLAAVHEKEMDKEDAVTDAEAAAVTADGGLDRLVRQVSAAIYFGDLAPSGFMRPVLSKQLTGMTSWPALLAKASQP